MAETTGQPSSASSETLSDASASSATDSAAGNGSVDASVGDGASTSPNATVDAESCELLTLKADRTAPDMLIVLDRSGSMSDEDNDVDRWGGSVDAINTIVAELDGAVSFGLMTFPGTDASNGGGRGDDDAGRCAPGSLDVPIGVMTAGPIAETLDNMEADGRTPTAQTLQEARQVLAATKSEAQADVEFAVPNQYVLLVTDGDPNCMNGGGGDGDTAAQQASIAEVQNLAGDDVKTYVVGFQTADSEFAGVLDEMAAAGDTGDTMHRSVDSGQTLLEELRRIAGSAVSCSFVLSQDVDERRVRIEVDGLAAEYGTEWDIRDDARTVDLLGEACEALQTGATVEAEVVCEVLQII